MGSDGGNCMALKKEKERHLYITNWLLQYVTQV